jgi:dTDP-4-dehydrorhamnose reductase
MRLLITGAAGMLGQDLVAAADGRGIDWVAPAIAELDITDPEATHTAITEAAPDVVVNCAAWTDVDGAEEHEAQARAVNADGAGNLAWAAAETGAWTVHISTDYVFDGAKRGPYVESDPTGPLSAYGRSKLAGEQAVAAAAPSAHTIIRSSWLFGAGGPCFPATILGLASDRYRVKVVDDQAGCPTFTGHLAKAILDVCDGRPVGVIHVAGGGSCSWFRFAQEIVASAGLHTEVLPCSTAEMPRPATRPANSVLGTERPGEAPALPDWRRGLEEYMALRTPAR